MIRCSSMMLAGLLLALSACNSGDPRCTKLPGGGGYCLQATSVLPSFDVQQKVETLFNGRHETLIVELEVDLDSMRFVGLTPFGQKMLQMSYDNRVVSAPVLPDARIDPVLMLAMLQLALWPRESVQAGLDEGLVIGEHGGQRQLMMNGKLVMAVSYTGAPVPYGDMHIEFTLAGLELDIKTLDSSLTK
ncbi:MAG: DUF3261 domain-containing protein [Betaproteobacteria bacterium]